MIGVAALPERIRRSLRDRWGRLRALAVVVAQSSVAAALAWEIATRFVGNPQPFFAPIAAVVTLGIATGQRFRRAAELVLGVVLGITLGDALLYVIGTGTWQVAVFVALAMILTILAGGSAMVVSQAAISAVLVGTMAPAQDGIYFARAIDALVGGGTALAVMAILLPVNPLTVVSRVARPALGIIIDSLDAMARGLAEGDPDEANRALLTLSEGEEKLVKFRETLPQGREAATVAPLRWRARNALRQYVESARYINRVAHNSRVMARRTVTLIRDGEPRPKELSASVAALAEAAKVVRRDLHRGSVPQDVADLVRRAVREASAAYRHGLGFSGNVVVAQIRAIATDLLGTTGLTHEEANQEVRRAGGTMDSR